MRLAQFADWASFSITKGDKIMHAFQEFADIIKNSKKIAVLTGAGISTESGIPDFKTTTEEWKYILPREAIMSVTFLERHPKEFWPIYKETFKTKVFEDIKPNDGHKFLAELENMGKQVTIITQNVDGLHVKAGSSKVYEVHGTLQTAHCPKCKEVYDLNYIREHEVPRCNKKSSKGVCNFILHPDVVLFEAAINYYKESFAAVDQADLFITIGTSLNVSPINQLALNAKHNLYRDYPVHKVIINREATNLDYCFDTVINGEIGDILREVKKLL